jgi:hypothetical protein
MNVQDPILKERMLTIGKMMNSVEVSEDVWKEDNPIWQNTNNHVMLMLRTYYWKHETEGELKESFGAALDKMVWLYVSFPEWRVRIGWMFWFVSLYIIDKQVQKEQGFPFNPEVWNDPRKWLLAKDVESLNITMEKMDDVSPGGLSTEISH